MRKFIGFILLLLFLFLVGSVFMPIQLVVKKEIQIDNNKSVVYNKVQDIHTLQEWLKTNQRTKSEDVGKEVYWEINGETYHCTIDVIEPKNKVAIIAQEVESKKKIVATLTLTGLAEKVTQIALQVDFPKTLAPATRYDYKFEKKSIEREYESFLNYLKTESEKVPYERFHLSSSELLRKEETVFAIPRHSTPEDIFKDKTQEVDSLLIARLYHYKLLDSIYDKYVQYTDWSDSVVAYNICIPLLKNPTPKQTLWLHGGKIEVIEGRFYSSIYEGAPHDLPLAWDSLYQKLAQTENVAEGFPLEQLLQKTDSTEIRKLFIRLR